MLTGTIKLTNKERQAYASTDKDYLKELVACYDNKTPITYTLPLQPAVSKLTRNINVTLPSGTSIVLQKRQVC